jgi:hypothetical protein
MTLKPPQMERLLFLQAARDVSKLADPDHPEQVSQRAFDAVATY